MHPAWLTFAPLLAAAALVLWGGERLARREVETRTPADRERLHDFSAALRDELDWLDDRFDWHLSRLADIAAGAQPELLDQAAAELSMLRECHVYRNGSRLRTVTASRSAATGPRLPEVELAGGKRPLNPSLAVILPRESFDLAAAVSSGHVTAPDGLHQVHWVRRLDTLVAFTLDTQALRENISSYLTSWLPHAFAPLREAGELTALTGPGGELLAGSADTPSRGPAALVMPHRTGLGEWQLQAWDRRMVATAHDPATLAVAAVLGCALIACGAALAAQQRRALKRAEERVSFVNRVSHELGTPLTSILLNLDLAATAVDLRPADARRRLTLVHEEVRRLGRLVANVLTFSRSEKGKLEPSPVSCIPDRVVEDVLAQFQPSLDRRKIVIEWTRDAAESTRMDPDLLAQIAGNLISNVEKYAGRGAWMRIETRMSDAHFTLRISDRGPGIPADFREKIFAPFERVPAGVDEGSSGTGLGLAIARDLARRMGGDLLLCPSEIGSTFQLRLPAPPHLSLVHAEVA